MQFPRTSGILLHITSLPGPFCVGDFGAGAIEFVDFLEKSGQRIWQILPLGPPARGNSPYSCYSAFAGSTLLINPLQMATDGWLDAADVNGMETCSDETKASYATTQQCKHVQFEKAYAQSRESLSSNGDFKNFCGEHAYWLNDFARFEALMGHFNESNWTLWPTELVQRNADALAKWDDQLASQIEFSKFMQFVFDQQWKRVKKYANDRGIQVFGDMPIFVAHESADVWANQSLFCVDEQGKPTLVAGVPPDYFSKTGQLWGNPLYRWDALEKTNYAWWTARFEFSFRQVDLLRVDHFRGFESYWEIPADAETALSGRWKQGPREKPFEAARKQLGELPIVAEDLGMITDEVHQLRDRLGFPAMRVMQFGFDDADDVFHHPSHYPENCVAYTGTHDNDTLMGWYQKRDPDQSSNDQSSNDQSSSDQPSNDLLREVLDGDDEIHMQLIAAVMKSNANTVVTPLQDALGLDSDSRMNVPGEADGNWGWRARSQDLSDQLATKLRQITVDSNR
ncbi:MAG: 4-alpha-glucanotransferase [Pirellulaceae bacterium]